MSIEFVPISACRIDVSGIQDVDRERLKATFENGRVLYFRYSPGLGYFLVDGGDRHWGLGDGQALLKELFDRFCVEQFEQSFIKRLLNMVRGLPNPQLRASYTGHSADRLFDIFQVELWPGNELRASDLAKGRHLTVHYGTRWSNPRETVISWGHVTSIDEVMLKPTPAVAVHNVA